MEAKQGRPGLTPTQFIQLITEADATGSLTPRELGDLVTQARAFAVAHYRVDLPDGTYESNVPQTVEEPLAKLEAKYAAVAPKH